MSKKAKVVTYPYLNKLKIPVYLEPIPHVKSADIDNALTKEQIKLFNSYFGCQTMCVVDGLVCPYPWDCEDVLVRIFSKKLQGTQLIMD